LNASIAPVTARITRHAGFQHIATHTANTVNSTPANARVKVVFSSLTEALSTFIFLISAASFSRPIPLNILIIPSISNGLRFNILTHKLNLSFTTAATALASVPHVFSAAFSTVFVVIASVSASDCTMDFSKPTFISGDIVGFLVKRFFIFSIQSLNIFFAPFHASHILVVSTDHLFNSITFSAYVFALAICSVFVRYIAASPSAVHHF